MAILKYGCLLVLLGTGSLLQAAELEPVRREDPLAVSLDRFDKNKSTSTAKKKLIPSPYAENLSKRFKVEPKVLAQMEKDGFGRTELLRLLLISQKSDRSLEELGKKRKKGTRLRELAEESQMDYKATFEEAMSIHKDIRKEIKAAQKEKFENEEKVTPEEKKQ